MNIKLKAILITITIFVGIFGGAYAVITEPLILAVIASLVVFYGMYKIILDSLERKISQ